MNLLIELLARIKIMLMKKIIFSCCILLLCLRSALAVVVPLTFYIEQRTYNIIDNSEIIVQASIDRETHHLVKLILKQYGRESEVKLDELPIKYHVSLNSIYIGLEPALNTELTIVSIKFYEDDESEDANGRLQFIFNKGIYESLEIY